MTGRPPRTPPHDRRRDAAQALLARFTRPDDDEYATAAARRGVREPAADRRRTGGPGMAAFGAAVAVLAILITMAALETRAGAPLEERDREALLAGIRSEQAAISEVRDQAEQLSTEVESLRVRSVRAAEQVADLESRLAGLGGVVGAAAVTGPGVQVTVDDAASGAAEGAILDTDLQLLVNGLWQAGAEAVAINGQRLTALSAIRTAGEAITVNFRSLSPPYTVSAIGDRSSLPARLLETEAGQTFADLQANFGITFAVETREQLQLPAASNLVVRPEPAADSRVRLRPRSGGDGS